MPLLPLDIVATYDYTLRNINSSAWILSLPLHTISTYNYTPLILRQFERPDANFILFTPHETKVSVKHISLPWSIFRSHETESASIEQSPFSWTRIISPQEIVSN